MRDHFDVAIVGAGAAGLAAAMQIRESPLDSVVLEARARIGGRACTLHPRPALPLDSGCGWMHAADCNILAPLIENKGFVLDRTAPHWQRQSGDKGFAAADHRAFGEAYDAFEERLVAAAATGVDSPAAAYFDPPSRWNTLIDAVSSYYNGIEYDQVSVLDYAAYKDTNVNWRVRDGYGDGIAAAAGPLDPVLGCAVTQIDHSKTPIEIVTSKGIVSARAVIITVPTSLLSEEQIKFHPRLPQKVAAAAGVPLGWAEKAFLHLSEPDDLPIEGHLFGRTDRVETGSYHLRPFGRPYIEAYLGGHHARALAREGPGAMIAFAVDELSDLLGSHFRKSASPVFETTWAVDPWSRGSYSHAVPGAAGARADLARPLDGRLFFAGEATHPTFFSTAHGAWESGIRAANEVRDVLCPRGR